MLVASVTRVAQDIFGVKEVEDKGKQGEIISGCGPMGTLQIFARDQPQNDLERSGCYQVGNAIGYLSI